MKQRRVLVVEDSEAAATMLVRALGHSGYEVRWEGTGAGAMSVAADWSPQAVLMDRRLPDADGLDLARKLGRKGAKVIMLSGDPLPPEARRGLAGFLMKPASLRDVLGALKALEA